MLTANGSGGSVGAAVNVAVAGVSDECHKFVAGEVFVNFLTTFFTIFS
jgi:hypothetical protein